MEKTIYDLELHEEIQLLDSQFVKRVPGGWVYSYFSDLNVSVFVPYNEEFNKNAVEPMTSSEDDHYNRGHHNGYQEGYAEIGGGGFVVVIVSPDGCGCFLLGRCFSFLWRLWTTGPSPRTDVKMSGCVSQVFHYLFRRGVT